MTIFVTWQLIVTLDSIRNSCDVFHRQDTKNLNVDKQFIFSSKAKDRDSGLDGSEGIRYTSVTGPVSISRTIIITIIIILILI